MSQISSDVSSTIKEVHAGEVEKQLAKSENVQQQELDWKKTKSKRKWYIIGGILLFIGGIIALGIYLQQKRKQELKDRFSFGGLFGSGSANQTQGQPQTSIWANLFNRNQGGSTTTETTNNTSTTTRPLFSQLFSNWQTRITTPKDDVGTLSMNYEEDDIIGNEIKDNTNVKATKQATDTPENDADPTSYDVDPPNPQVRIGDNSLKTINPLTNPLIDNSKDVKMFKEALNQKYTARYGSFWKWNFILMTQYQKEVKLFLQKGSPSATTIDTPEKPDITSQTTISEPNQQTLGTVGSVL